MYKVGIITASDKGSAGLREDISGPAIKAILENYADDFTVAEYIMIPDEKDQIAAAIKKMADEEGIDLIVTTGGTGFSKRDVTPEATLQVIERRTPGIPEAMRLKSLEVTPRGMLSRAEAGIRGDSLIVNLPGSPKAINECFDYIVSSLKHGLDMLQAKDGECASK